MKRLLIIIAVILSITSFTTAANPVSKSTNLACLSSTIYYEAIGEPKAGQIAVAQTVINRKNHPRYANSICTVISESHQYQWFSNQKLPIMVFPETKDIAKEVISGKVDIDPAKGATHFHNLTVNPDWAKRMKLVARIGNHKFYREYDN